MNKKKEKKKKKEKTKMNCNRNISLIWSAENNIKGRSTT